jgi:two-component system, OmpR family, response regulator
MQATVGICEDDHDLRGALVRALESEGYLTRTAATGRQAMASFGNGAVDALILDIGLPDADGRDVCQALRAHGVRAPVLFLTARDALVDRLSGFGAGGDDYVTKPFALAELQVRLRVLLRRVAPDPADLPAGLRLDPAEHALRLGDRTERLTPTEFRLIAVLAASPGAVIRRRDLLAAGWPDGALVHDNTLHSFVTRVAAQAARRRGRDAYRDRARGRVHAPVDGLDG